MLKSTDQKLKFGKLKAEITPEAGFDNHETHQIHEPFGKSQ
jgi:hypothetical protein